MRKLSIIFALVLLLNIFLPFGYADADKGAGNFDNLVGKKQSVDNNTDVTYLRSYTVDGKTVYEYRATIHQAPIYNDDGTPVDCQWYGSGNSYYIKDNVFSATATGAQIEITYQGEVSSWNPVVMIDGKQYTAIGNPKIINDPSNANYVGNVLEWDYGICKRHLRVIEGLIQDLWIFESDPGGNVWIRDNATKSKGFTWAIAPYAFDADGNDIPVNQYKQVSAKDMSTAKYPVTIDPTSSFVTSASDGYMRGKSDTYSTAWAATSAGDTYSVADTINIGQYTQVPPYYYIYRAAVYFNTSGIPDAVTITEASLYLYGDSDYSVTNFDITIQPQYRYWNGMDWVIAPSDPLTGASYNKVYYSGNGGSLGTAGFSTAGYNEITLNADGRSWVNVSSDTVFMLRSSRDIAGTSPASDTNEYVTVFSYEKGDGYRPYLEVTYVANTVPTVTTQAATYVTKTSARLNGYLDADGGNACNVSFRYALWNGSAWGENVSTTIQTGKVTGNSFYADLTGLANTSTYRCMALATNTVGTSYGSWLNFSTLETLSAPSSVICDADGTSVTLSWHMGDGSNATYIRYKTGSYPTDTSDGNVLALAPGTGYTHSGLTAGTTYFYKLWGADGVGYSTANATTVCTTTVATAAGATPAAPTEPDGWTGVLNGSLVSNLPIYEFGNLIADEGGIPYNTFWGVGSLLLIVILALIFYNRTHNVFLTGLIAIVGLIALGALQVIPYALTALFIMVALVVTLRESRSI